MKTVIAGSRNFTDYAQLLRAIATCPFEITEVISTGNDSAGPEAGATVVGVQN